MQQSSNNLCTVLLLLALGYLIYYLMKTHKKVSSEVKPEKSKEKFTDDSGNYEKPGSLKYVKNSNLNNGLEHTEYLADSQINNSASVNSDDEMPITKTNINPNVVNSITGGPVNKSGDFKAFDDDYTPFTNLNGKIDNYGNSVGWSDLNSAFSGPLADTNNTLDLVKMNHAEMKNYNSDDFLPKEVINGAFDDYSQAKYAIDNDNLINTDRYVVGINTVGQSLKNGSHDIRGTIPNPKFSVSPWNNSTYEPDYNIKPLC